MPVFEQKIEDITGSLTTLEAPWQDEHAARVMALIQGIPAKGSYGNDGIGALFDKDFEAAFTAAYLFLGVSKDEFQDRLAQALPRATGSIVSRKTGCLSATRWHNSICPPQSRRP